MAGDVHGNTFYVRNGRVPIRPSGFDWTKPVLGNTSETAWKGIHPFKDLVQIENPDQGYMQNCNIAPDTMMENCPLTADRYPSYIFNDSPGRTNTRGIRAVELLSRAFNITVDEFIEFALDDKWIGTSAWQEALRRALNKNTKLVRTKPQRFRHFVHRILHFDGFARADSVAALNYFYWRETLASMLSRAELEKVNNVIWEMEELTADHNKMLLEAVDRSIKTMITEHGSTNLRYGDVFRAGRGGFSYSASGGTIQAGSEFAPVGPRPSLANQPVVTLRAFSFTPPDSRGLRWVFSGSHETRVTIYTNPIQSFTAMHLGQSDRPDSPHYSDQARLISERRLKPTYFYKEDLLKHVTSTQTLEVYFE
jgi:acyl-homoserine lactone acylase PvdQ